MPWLRWNDTEVGGYLRADTRPLLLREKREQWGTGGYVEPRSEPISTSGVLSALLAIALILVVAAWLR